MTDTIRPDLAVRLTGPLGRLAMLLRLGRLLVAAHNIAITISDYWLAMQIETACWYSWRLAPAGTCGRARMYGEIFCLTGDQMAGWPYRYMPEYADGAANAGQLLL
jgi:hypothetical protein